MITIIPAIDIIDGHCVRLSEGDYSRETVYFKNPLDAALMFEDYGLQRLHIVDLDGAKGDGFCNLHVLEKIASRTSLTIDYSGGIRNITGITDALNAGAAEVGIGSMAVREPAQCTVWLDRFGSRIVIGADCRDGKLAVKGWLESTNATPEELLTLYQSHGLKRAVYTDISRDGMLCGPDTEGCVKLQTAFPDIEITASGGVSTMNDIEALDAAGIRSVIVGKAIYEGRINLKDLTL